MKQVFKQLKEQAGYVSIETVIVAGLMIGLGAFAIGQFYDAGEATTTVAIENVNEVLDVAVNAGA